MSESSKFKPFLLTTISFLGGVITGMYLSPKKDSKDRSWFEKQVKDVSKWTQKQHKKMVNNRSDNLYQLRHHLHQGIQQNVPDAYEATEYISLSGNDVLHE